MAGNYARLENMPKGEDGYREMRRLVRSNYSFILTIPHQYWKTAGIDIEDEVNVPVVFDPETMTMTVHLASQKPSSYT